MTWTVDHHDHTTARNALVALWQEVQTIYATSEDDPTSVVICPQLNPLPFPGLEDIEKEDWKTGKLTIRVLRENGVLVVVLLMLDNKVRYVGDRVAAVADEVVAAHGERPRPF